MTSHVFRRAAVRFLSFPRVRTVCVIYRIHHSIWCSVGAGKPEGQLFQLETRLAEFPTECWARGLGLFWNHQTVMINHFSQITILHLVTYCRIFVDDVTELMFTVNGRTVQMSTFCRPNYHNLKQQLNNSLNK